MRVFATLLAVLCVLVAAEASRSQSQQGFQLIVNRSNSTSSLPRSVVSQMLMKKVGKWENGVKVEPVDLKASNTTRGKFSYNVHKKSVSAVKAYWQQQIFSGRAVPPPEMPSDARVISYVESRVGAIGYVSPKAEVGRGVRVVRVAW